MAEPKPRVFEYDVAYDGEGRATAQESTIDEVPRSGRPSISCSPACSTAR